MLKIYVLKFEGKVVYVGKTKQTLKKRKSIGYKSIPFWRECDIVLIDESDVRGIEDYWVNYYKELGCELYNVRKGDTGLSRKEWRDENKEKAKEYIKKYYEDNKESISEYQKKYQEDNKETLKEYKRLYYQKNKNK